MTVERNAEYFAKAQGVSRIYDKIAPRFYAMNQMPQSAESAIGRRMLVAARKEGHRGTKWPIKEKQKTTETQHQVIATVRKIGPACSRRVAAAAGLNPGTVQTALRALASRGDLTRRKGEKGEFMETRAHTIPFVYSLAAE